jgi:hypothetical protein
MRSGIAGPCAGAFHHDGQGSDGHEQNAQAEKDVREGHPDAFLTLSGLSVPSVTLVIGTIASIMPAPRKIWGHNSSQKIPVLRHIGHPPRSERAKIRKPSAATMR